MTEPIGVPPDPLTAVPLTVEHDLEHGGRWTSLRTPTREWLWRNPDPDTRAGRATVGPGDAFVDAGGGEECFPTVQGVPDHGDIWSRRWAPTGETPSGASEAAVVHTGAFTLTRTLTVNDAECRIDYVITGPPGAGFVHAVHLLLDVDVGARLSLPAGATVRVAGGRGEFGWPMVHGADQSQLGPDDGSARCLILPGTTSCQISDDRGALDFNWTSDGDSSPAGLLLWRNLGGWPADSPYRSIGVEPMLGSGVDHASGADCARLDSDGRARWTLRVSASGQATSTRV